MYYNLIIMYKLNVSISELLNCIKLIPFISQRILIETDTSYQIYWYYNVYICYIFVSIFHLKFYTTHMIILLQILLRI